MHSYFNKDLTTPPNGLRVLRDWVMFSISLLTGFTILPTLVRTPISPWAGCGSITPTGETQWSSGSTVSENELRESQHSPSSRLPTVLFSLVKSSFDSNCSCPNDSGITSRDARLSDLQENLCWRSSEAAVFFTQLSTRSDVENNSASGQATSSMDILLLLRTDSPSISDDSESPNSRGRKFACNNKFRWTVFSWPVLVFRMR